MTRNGNTNGNHPQHRTYPTSPWTEAFDDGHENWATQTTNGHQQPSTMPAAYTGDASQQPTHDALTNVYNWGHQNA